jgi:hypothetical protein
MMKGCPSQVAAVAFPMMPIEASVSLNKQQGSRGFPEHHVVRPSLYGWKKTYKLVGLNGGGTLDHSFTECPTIHPNEGLLVAHVFVQFAYVVILLLVPALKLYCCDITNFIRLSIVRHLSVFVLSLLSLSSSATAVSESFVSLSCSFP